MITVTIRRSLWGKDALYNPKSKRYCCLGFCAKHAGYETKQLVGVELFLKSEFNKTHKKWDDAKNIFPKLSLNFQQELADINDSTVLPMKAKEEQIKVVGARAGINFQFVD